VLSVLRFTGFDYPFDIFKLLCFYFLFLIRHQDKQEAVNVYLINYVCCQCIPMYTNRHLISTEALLGFLHLTKTFIMYPHRETTGKSKHFRVFERKQSKGYGQVNRQILVMVLFLSILALTYEVPKN
jgi:hypothetical protein